MIHSTVTALRSSKSNLVILIQLELRIPGLGIAEPTDQMIKFASILPLSTPGYQVPEVSIRIAILQL